MLLCILMAGTISVLHQRHSAVIAANGASLCCLNVCKKDACQVGDLLRMSEILLSAAAYFDALCVCL